MVYRSSFFILYERKINRRTFLRESKSHIGQNDFGFVYEQGEINNISSLKSCLQKAGGKPKDCELTDYNSGGNGRAKPEFIITFNEDSNLLVVVECKKTVGKHKSEYLNHPRDYAIDGVLYYAKFLKEKYNVIAVAVSGTKKETAKVSTFIGRKGLIHT